MPPLVPPFCSVQRRLPPASALLATARSPPVSPAPRASLTQSDPATELNCEFTCSLDIGASVTCPIGYLTRSPYRCSGGRTAVGDPENRQSPPTRVQSLRGAQRNEIRTRSAGARLGLRTRTRGWGLAGLEPRRSLVESVRASHLRHIGSKPRPLEVIFRQKWPPLRYIQCFLLQQLSVFWRGERMVAEELGPRRHRDDSFVAFS